MTVRITQIIDEKRVRAVLRVEGKLHDGGAEILEKVFDEIRSQSNREIDIDIAGVSFIDTNGAAVLKRIEAKGAVLSGLDFFIEKVIETYEETK